MRSISLLTRFNDSGEHLLAPQGMFGRARKTPASRRLFPACLAALLARQSPFLVAHIAQPLAQRLEVIKTGIIDSGVVTAQDDLMLIVAKNAAFEFAGYGQPETILRWHRVGFTGFWRWKSRNRTGRPKIDRDLRDLIQRMSKENPLWGASRIHGELLMLGFEVAQSTVSKYMVRGRMPPSQSWKTFLRNHAQAIAAID